MIFDTALAERMGSGSILGWGDDNPKLTAGVGALFFLNAIIWGVQGDGLVALVWLLGCLGWGYRTVRAMD